ncbi:hypothetical protein ANRL3_02300 [Anaerolineae bacterium]|nr:hypothetical protein ANRL3_02300 [Anaerolineae bacterium]
MKTKEQLLKIHLPGQMYYRTKTIHMTILCEVKEKPECVEHDIPLHEAAHWVTGIVMGWPVGKVTVDPDLNSGEIYFDAERINQSDKEENPNFILSDNPHEWPEELKATLGLQMAAIALAGDEAEMLAAGIMNYQPVVYANSKDEALMRKYLEFGGFNPGYGMLYAQRLARKILIKEWRRVVEKREELIQEALTRV